MDRISYFLKIVLGHLDPPREMYFYEAWDIAGEPLLTRLCELFREKYLRDLDVPFTKPEFTFEPAGALGPNQAFLVREDLMRLHNAPFSDILTPEKMHGQRYFVNSLVLGQATELLPEFCHRQAKYWEKKLRQEMDYLYRGDLPIGPPPEPADNSPEESGDKDTAADGSEAAEANNGERIVWSSEQMTKTRIEALRADCRGLLVPLESLQFMTVKYEGFEEDWGKVRSLYRVVTMSAAACGAEDFIRCVGPLMESAEECAGPLIYLRDYRRKLERSTPDKVAPTDWAESKNEEVDQEVWDDYGEQYDLAFQNYGDWWGYKSNETRSAISEREGQLTQGIDDLVVYLNRWLLPHADEASSDIPDEPGGGGDTQHSGGASTTCKDHYIKISPQSNSAQDQADSDDAQVSEDEVFFYKAADSATALKLTRLFNKAYGGKPSIGEHRQKSQPRFSCHAADTLDEDEVFLIDDHLSNLQISVGDRHYEWRVDEGLHIGDHVILGGEHLLDMKPPLPNDSLLDPVRLYDQAERWEEQLRSQFAAEATETRTGNCLAQGSPVLCSEDTAVDGSEAVESEPVSDAEPDCHKPSDEGTIKPIDRMLFTEDLPMAEHKISAVLADLVDSLTGFADLLVSKCPVPWVDGYGDDTHSHAESLWGRHNYVKELAALVWSYPAFSPAHAQDIENKFDQLMDMAREYPARLEKIAVERDKRVAHFFELYDAKFSSDRERLENEIKAQGGYDSVSFELTYPGQIPTTVKGFANGIRMTCHEAECMERRCQADLWQAVLDYIELLVTLNNRIVRPYMGRALPADAAGDQRADDRPTQSDENDKSQSQSKITKQELGWLAGKWLVEHPNATEGDISEAMELASGDDRESEILREVRRISGLLRQLTGEEQMYFLRTQLHLLAQTYYALVEAAATSEVGWMDYNLERAYLGIVKNIEYQLTLPELADFPGGFEPVADSLFHGGDLDCGWDEVSGPAARDFVSRTLAYQLKAEPVTSDRSDIIETLLVATKFTCAVACQIDANHRKQAAERFQRMVQNEQVARATDAKQRPTVGETDAGNECVDDGEQDRQALHDRANPVNVAPQEEREATGSGKAETVTREQRLVAIAKRFSFPGGLALLDGEEMEGATGLKLSVLDKLVKNIGKVVTHQELGPDPDNPNRASDNVRGAVTLLGTILSDAEIPVVIKNVRGQGYYMTLCQEDVG